MTPRCAPWVLVLALLLASAPAARADEVELTDGSSFPGRVQEFVDGNLKIRTEAVGTLKVPSAKVLALRSERRFRVRLLDGATYVGTVVLREGVLEIRDGEAPPVQAGWSQVESLRPAEGAWSGHLTLSYSGERGNSDSNTIVTLAELVWETAKDRAIFRGNWMLGDEDGVLTDRSAYALLKEDHRLSESVYIFASGEARTDTFEDLKYRSVTSAGPGWLIARRGGVDLWAEAGPAFLSEELRDGTKDSWFGGRAAIHLNWKLPFGLELRDDLTFYPNFEEGKNWQLHNEGSLSTQLGEHWWLTASIITDLDHQPLPGKTKEDHSFLVGLRFRF